MRKQFAGYYAPTDADLEELWTTGVVVLDTNVLLNFYRYSKESRTALLDLVIRLKDRLWMPYQVGIEYHRRRLPQIYDERRNGESFIASLRESFKTLDESRRHPFVGLELRKKLDQLVLELEVEIKPAMDELDSFKRNDPILQHLTDVYENRVGNKPDDKQIEEWKMEGEVRYRNGIPPGFEDRKKADEKKFGDLFIWKEIIAYASASSVPILFVTDDSKEDWWRKQNGETIGPNPLLAGEIIEATGKPFHMYKPELFVKLSGEHLKNPLPEKVVTEVKNVRIADSESAKTRVLGSDLAKTRISDLLTAKSISSLLGNSSLANAMQIRDAMNLQQPLPTQTALSDALKLINDQNALSLALDSINKHNAYSSKDMFANALRGINASIPKSISDQLTDVFRSSASAEWVWDAIREGGASQKYSPPSSYQSDVLDEQKPERDQ